MALKFQNALSPAALSQIYTMLNQMRATGRVVTPKDIEAAYKAVLSTEAEKSLQNRQLAMNRDQWLRQMQFQKKMYEDKKDADTMAGYGQGAALLMSALKPNAQGVSPLGSAWGYIKKPFESMGGLFTGPKTVPTLGPSLGAPIMDSMLMGLGTPTEAVADVAPALTSDFLGGALSGDWLGSGGDAASNLFDTGLQTLSESGDLIGDVVGNLFSDIGGMWS